MEDPSVARPVAHLHPSVRHFLEREYRLNELEAKSLRSRRIFPREKGHRPPQIKIGLFA